MIKKSILIIPLLLQFCTQYDKSDIDTFIDDEYKIFSCILNQLPRRDSIKIFLDKNTIAFYRDSPPLGFFEGPTKSQQKDDRIKTYFDYFFASGKFDEFYFSRSKYWMQLDHNELLKDLLIKNIYSYTLLRGIINGSISSPIVSIFESQFHPNPLNKDEVRVGFSRVGFNSSLSQAVVYVSFYCGILCASWDFYLLQKIDSNWQVLEKINLAVS